MNEAQTASSAIIKSMVVNGALAAVKVSAGWLGNSYALIADGIESINDVFSSAVVLLSLRVSAKPADEDHPYGHGRAEQLGALFSALSLLGAGAMIAYESSQNLIHRHTAPAWFTLPILVLVILVKEALSRYALKKSDEVSSSALKGDAWHHRSDAITSGAAFIGIAIALIGGPGYEKADDVAALLGCMVIAVNGIKLFKDALHENMDGAPAAEFRRSIELLALSVPGVLAVEKLRMKKVGLSYHMDLHVQVRPDMTVDEGHRITGIVKRTLLEAGKRVSDVVIHLEPHHCSPEERSSFVPQPSRFSKAANDEPATSLQALTRPESQNQPNPTQPNPTQPNPTQPNPTQPVTKNQANKPITHENNRLHRSPHTHRAPSLERRREEEGKQRRNRTHRRSGIRHLHRKGA